MALDLARQVRPRARPAWKPPEKRQADELNAIDDDSEASHFEFLAGESEDRQPFLQEITELRDA